MHRLRTHLQRLPDGVYGLLWGLTVFAVLLGVFPAEGVNTSGAVLGACGAGVGAAFGCVASRHRRTRWWRRFAKRS